MKKNKIKGIKFKRILQDIMVEMAHFEDFIIASLKKEGLVKYDFFDERMPKTVNPFDAFLPNGLRDITDKPSFLEILYTKDSSTVNDHIKRIVSLEKDISVIVLTLLSKDEIRRLQTIDGYIVLGLEYLKKLVFKNPNEWLIFSASCSKYNIVSYDESEDLFTVNNQSAAGLLLKVKVSLKADQIKELSEINKVIFRNAISKFSNPALFIGNGASVCFGSDLWTPLCNYLFDYLKPKYVDRIDLVKKAIGNTTFSLSSMSKYLIDEEKYYSAIYSSIYRKYEFDMHNDNTLIRVAVKAKIKYPEMPIVSYNYDNYFERDYEIYSNNDIKSVETRASDKKTTEPKVLHVHGLFPYEEPKAKPKLVLTQEDYYKAYVGSSWTPDVQKKILSENTCLFIGSSMSDLYQMSIIDEVQKRYYSKQHPIPMNGPWKCFALLCFEGMTPRDIVSTYNFYTSKGVYVIFVNEFKQLPSELKELFDL